MMRPTTTWVQIHLGPQRNGPAFSENSVPYEAFVLRVHNAAPSAKDLARDDVDMLLFRIVQRYLTRLSEGERPDSTERDRWEQFYRQFDPYVRRLVKAWRLPAADTDDVVQEIWADLVTRLTGLNYDPRRGRLHAWLFTFVRRKVIRFLQRKSRHSVQQLLDPAESLTKDDGDPAAACLRQENRRLVRRTLAVLRTRISDTNYQVLHLRWIDGRSSADIAAQVNISPDQVRYRLTRMKRKLRTLLEKKSRHT